MTECEQMPGLSVMAHGESVWDYYQDLIEHLTQSTPLAHPWRLPDWVRDPLITSNQLDHKTVKEYLIFHDCGKPYCRTVDEGGRQHFPDHARVSEALWRSIGGNDQSARLMGMDMDIHLLKGEGVEAFSCRPEATTLLLAGLCEVHSNAEMFGGIESVGFKMKMKQIDRRGKRIVALLGSR
jgi:hypothetical protein